MQHSAVSNNRCVSPHSNAHGPNEFLHIDTGKRLTASVAYVIANAKN